MRRFTITAGSALTCAALSTLSLSAQAADLERDGLYGYGGIGANAFNWDKPKNADGTKPKDPNSSNVGINLGVGYRVNNYLAFETGYTSTLARQSGKTKDSLAADSFNIGVLGIVPIGQRFELFAKAAAGKSNMRYTPASPGVKQKAINDHQTTVAIGLGANYHVNDRLSVRLEVLPVHASSKAFREKTGVKNASAGMVTLGVNYRF